MGIEYKKKVFAENEHTVRAQIYRCRDGAAFKCSSKYFTVSLSDLLKEDHVVMENMLARANEWADKQIVAIANGEFN